MVVLAEERLPSYPEIPTSLEYGINITPGRWRGLGVKAGTPKDIVKELERIIKKALDSEECKALTKRTVTDQRPGFTPSDETKEKMDRDFETYKKVMKELKMVK